jgi:galactokinase
MADVVAFAPGRVNLIGDHTDYTGGLVLPMAVDLGTTVSGRRGGDRVVLRSAEEPEPAVVPLDIDEPAAVEPPWARYVAGVVAELRPPVGLTGTVATTLPVGSGLSSSAALDSGSPLALAELCQRAEQRASGVPCGIMDQLASTAGIDGHALLIDCHTHAIEPIPLSDDVDVVVVDSGERRALARSAYAERRAECEAAEAIIGPLRRCQPGEEEGITDVVLRRRARHVIGENARVRAFAAALTAGDMAAVGAAMAASHASLADDFAVSTPTLDALAERLSAVPGVHGARLTGAGFGGCVVALASPGALAEGWRVRPASGARLISDPNSPPADRLPADGMPGAGR